MAFGGLLLIALGTGGIKPCVAAFGGDQFKEHQVIKSDWLNILLNGICVCTW